jgi:hypothetical protein
VPPVPRDTGEGEPVSLWHGCTSMLWTRKQASTGPACRLAKPLHAAFELSIVEEEGIDDEGGWQGLKGPTKPFRRPCSGFLSPGRTGGARGRPWASQ